MRAILGVIGIGLYLAIHITDKVFTFFGGDIDKVGIFGDVSYFSDAYYVLLFLPIAVISVIVLIVVYDLIIRLFNYIYHALNLDKNDKSKAEDITLESLVAGTEEKRKEDEKGYDVSTLPVDIKQEERAENIQNNNVSTLPVVITQEEKEQDVKQESIIKQKTESNFGCGCCSLIIFCLVVLIELNRFRSSTLTTGFATLDNVIGFILAGIVIFGVIGYGLVSIGKIFGILERKLDALFAKKKNMAEKNLGQENIEINSMEKGTEENKEQC